MKDIFVVFSKGGGDIKGDSTDSIHGMAGTSANAKNALEVSSWRHKITQPKSSTASTAGGHTAERTEHEEMFFTKDIDSASPKLWHAASAGTYYELVEVYFYRALGGKNTSGADVTRVNYLKIEMKDVVVSSVETNIGAGELPAETFGLKYSAIKWTYNRANVDGTVSNATGTGSWNLKTNKTAF